MTKVLLWTSAGATGVQSARRCGTPWIAVVDRPNRRGLMRWAGGGSASPSARTSAVQREVRERLGGARLAPAEPRRPALRRRAGRGSRMQSKAARAVGRRPAEQPGLGGVGRHRGDGEAMVGEHVLDRLVLVFAEALQHDERGRRGLGQQQLGDDLVGAAEVEQVDVGEVEVGR